MCDYGATLSRAELFFPLIGPFAGCCDRVPQVRGAECYRGVRTTVGPKSYRRGWDARVAGRSAGDRDSGSRTKPTNWTTNSAAQRWGYSAAGMIG